MAEYKLSITADGTIQKLIFAGKEYSDIWIEKSGSKTLEKAIATQIFEDCPGIDEELLKDIDDISCRGIFGIRVVLERLEEYEK